MNYRNHQYNALGAIDCEIEHPQYGWIPFTASPDDPEPHGRELFAAASATAIAYVAPARPLAEVKTEKLAALAALRYAKETAGIVVNGATVSTGRESQSLLTGAYTSVKNGLVSSIDWKAGGGVWVTLGLAQIEPLAAAVSAHVQACFTNEKAHAQSIAALATAAAVDAYDITTGWPA